MTAGTVILWRHGRTAYNAAGRLQGQIDIEMDEVGRWQVARAARHLAHAHAPTRIVSSDLGRAVATATSLADRVGVEVETDPRLRERSFGEWEGMSVSEIAERWPQEYALWQSGHDPARANAESRSTVADRVAAAVVDLAGSMAREETLVVASHGAAITLGVTAMLGLDANGWRGLVGMHNAHWSIMRASRGDAIPSWRLESHNIGPSVRVADWEAGVPSDSLPSSAADALRT